MRTSVSAQMGKGDLSLQRKIIPNYYNLKFLSREALFEAGPGKEDKRKLA